MKNNTNNNNNNPKFKFLLGLDRDLQQGVLKQLKVLWTYSSNALEGNTLSLGDTKFIIEEGITIGGKTIKEHDEVMSHVRALDILYNFLDNEEITKKMLFSLHQAIQTEYIVDIYCPIGNWKNEINGTYINIDGKLKYYTYPHPKDIDYLMSIWLDNYRKMDSLNLNLNDVITKYAQIHLGFVSIHPFFDGNGRIARLISNLPILKSGYPPITISKESRKKYLEILHSYQSTSEKLTSKSTKIIDINNPNYDRFIEFCKNEYKEIQGFIENAKIVQRKRKV